MADTTSFSVEKTMATALSCGRSLDQQVETIKKYGTHALAPMLRNLSLASHGVLKAKKGARWN
jgi:hypothetical protein